jgi:coproporphyrinogen III oxidase-like Fe-S oxidoreductase
MTVVPHGARDRPGSNGDAARIMDEFGGRPGLYLHVPFCSSLCPFCPYNKVRYERGLAHTYFEALEAEVARYIEHAPSAFSSLYVGGGTPTLCLDAIGRLVERLPIRGERAIEVLPGHATAANLDRLHELGFEFLSLGLQSFDPAMLAHLGRPNTVAQNHRALKATVGRFGCVDVDLIFDVAVEDESVVLRDLQTCFSASVDQVSTYPLMRFGFTPFGKAGHSPAREHRALRAAEELAHRYGYERRSVWTFNRRSSPNYTSITREFYLGCGAGAGTFTGRSFFVNHFSLARYLDKVRTGRLPIARVTRMSPRRAAVYYSFWQIYTGRIRLDRFEALFPGQHMLRGLLSILSGLGWLRRSGGDLVLTPDGYDHYSDLERWVTYQFIEPLWADMMREHAHLRGTLPPPSRLDRLGLQMAGLAA